MAFSLVYLLCSSLLHFLSVPSFAQTDKLIPVGASLSADENSFWSSPSGHFAFGFRQLNDSKDLFLLCIWFHKIQEKTIIWSANGENPAPRGSKLELTTDPGLVLNSPEGKHLWTSGTIIGVVAYGFLNDSGNFVLQDHTLKNLWESFRNPTDTMLPFQLLERGQFLSSRRSATNFSRGKFQFKLNESGNLVINTVNLPTDSPDAPFYEFGGNITGVQVLLNESGQLYVLQVNGQIFTPPQTVVAPSANFYYRLTVNSDGALIQYRYPKTPTGIESWTAMWDLPDNICTSSPALTGSGICGYNGICRLDGNKRPICGCPTGYSLLDPNNYQSGCKPNYTLSCEENERNYAEDLYGFEELENIDWPTADYAVLTPYDENQCKQSCLHDCMCSVAIFRAGNLCWKKKQPLSNGREDPNLNGKAFLKFRKSDVNQQGLLSPVHEMKNQKKKSENLILVESVLLGTSFFLNFILMGAICFGLFSIYQKKIKTLTYHGDASGINLHCFTYEELTRATDGFKEELGRGAFGIVYKGNIMRMGAHSLVAVKKLHTVMQDSFKEFKTEINVIGQTHHKNLIRLLGYCDEGQQQLLVYEFLSNGTLARFLFGESKLEWNLRTQIVIGIARGLLYLHEECSTQIIHCDIKPQNILVDDNYNPRISDFGLAKLLMVDQTQTYTVIRGTKGYVAPEWFRNWPITVKVDVYSFGVLLLEIICCRKGVDSTVSRAEEAILTEWAYDCYCEKKLDSLVAYDKEALADREALETFVTIAMWCIQEDPSLRPTMRKVTQMLEGVVKVDGPPCPWPIQVTS